MIIEPPKTIEDFKEVRASILELMGNPWCDHLMFMSLMDKRDAVDKKIEELQAEREEITKP
ncbi:MAG: hypothetical protein ACI9N9_000032 [Enterobacterales bacterium]|jgi:uncharacterized protein YdcH (DUF465 family)